MKSIGLCMIVKNEAHVIARCLESFLPLLDYVSIVDTGSTDETVSVIQKFLQERKIPGEVRHQPWQDFASNRTAALATLRDRREIDYRLMVDADQVAIYDDKFDADTFKAGLNRDVYDLKIRSGNIEYLLPQLTSNALDVRYKAVLHEYLECPDGATRGTASGITITEIHDGHRSTNARKYLDDAVLLEGALATETDPFLIARYRFYLAQSYRDYGDNDAALTNYLKRTKLGFWDEEVFLSFLYAGRLKEKLDHPDEQILTIYEKASATCPHRAEAFHAAAVFCRRRGLHRQGYQYAKEGLYLRCPARGLFLEKWIYDYGLLDELAYFAYWLDNYSESARLSLRLLEEEAVPESERARIRKNAEFSIAKLTPRRGSRENLHPLASEEVADLPIQAVGVQPPDAGLPARRSRYVVITPYHRESRRLLERCLKSVRRQSIMVDHIMVADGFAQEWVDHEPVRHLRLETAHNDFGNTPRGLGALLAVSEGYSGIAFLDADNWLAEDHIERCLEAAMTLKDCDYVVAKRYLMRPDETKIPIADEDSFVDTSCYFFLKGAYHVLHYWVTMPPALAPVCDRAFYAAAKSHKLRSAVVPRPTVYYECLWSTVYEKLGEAPPPNAKPNADFSTISRWLRSLTDVDLKQAVRRSGAPLNRDAEFLGELHAVSRNAVCPCGSGKRFKHCHGALE